MRLHFPNGEHADTALAEGRITIGSGAGQKLRIAHPAIAEAHLAIDLDPVRGIELTVLGAPAELHVNSRPVKHKAIARIGDLLLLGPVKLLLKPDTDQRETPPPALKTPAAETAMQQLPRAALRAVSGQYFGKIIALKARTVLGQASDCGLVLNEPGMARKHAVLENTVQGLYLRDLGSANGTFVNGVQVRDTVLKHGDQLAFELNRFLIEAPGGPAIEIGASVPAAPAAAQPVHTQVQRRLVPPPPPTPPPPATSTGVSRLINALMMFAGLVALAALVYVFWDYPKS